MREGAVAKEGELSPPSPTTAWRPPSVAPVAIVGFVPFFIDFGRLFSLVALVSFSLFFFLVRLSFFIMLFFAIMLTLRRFKMLFSSRQRITPLSSVNVSSLNVLERNAEYAVAEMLSVHLSVSRNIAL